MKQNGHSAAEISISAFCQQPVVKAMFCLTIGIASLPLPQPVMAAEAVSQQKHTLTINAGSLDQALRAFGTQTGILISVNAALTNNLTSQGLKGEYTVTEAFNLLLAGTGLAPTRKDGSQTYTLQKIPAEKLEKHSSQSLPEVNVVSTRENAWGPIDGYVARKSASASKMDTNLKETPQIVSVIGAEQIRDQAISSVTEAVRYSAGVRAWDYATTDDDIAVRGFYLTGTGLYRDGMRLIHNGFMSNIEPYGMEKLEVVHGPASVLYGQAAPGGLLNAVTKRPRADMRNEVGIELGSFGRKQAKLDVGGQLDQDGHVLARLTVLQRESGTQWKYQDNDRLYIAPSLTFQNESTRLTLLAQYQQDDLGFVIPYYRHTPTGKSKDNININGPHSGHKKESASFGYLFEHDFNETFSVRHNLRYLDGSNDRREMRNRGLRADGRSVTRLAMYRPDSEQTWVVDNQVEARFNTGSISHKTIIGLDYYRSKLNLPIYSLNGAVAPLDLLTPGYEVPDWGNNFLSDDTRAENLQIGYYLQDQIHFGKHWVLSLGARYDNADTDSLYRVRANANAPLTTTRHQRSDHDLTGRIGLIYLADNGLAPYISYNTSFQPPISTTTTVDYYGNVFEPEKGKQLELGLRYMPDGAPYSITAAVYELTKTNVRTISPLDSRREVQTGEVRSRGFELEGAANLGSGYSMLGSYTFIDTEIIKSNQPWEVGSAFAAAPRHVASIWGKYQQGSFSAGLGVRHVGTALGALPLEGIETPKNDRYTLLDAMAAYDFSHHWRLAVNASNLTDKEYLTQCNNVRGTGEFCILGYGRDIRASVTYVW
ncbi:TonB-dependent siderophore receptor [Methylobacillus gramineus]|uniref:TonB-dependent siderophore receptor n=1 Tax=Methylobacillus gramineus TaxID=755169 RepID=UPI001CFFD06C|nr:TonB-dependent siderophore receptor [Methylobacillus gramineus]MCB5184807.1 TonB-dependent siderophore receptor [Methylobacillus gramineus]